MIKTKLFKRALLLLFIIGILNWIGDTLYLFNSIWWYDIMLHLLSGTLIGISVFIVFDAFSLFKKYSKRKLICMAVLFAFAIGIIWECYELYFGITFLSDGAAYVFDTAKDLTDDVVGAFLGSLYGWYILKQNHAK